jgi:hypothetical protein
MQREKIVQRPEGNNNPHIETLADGDVYRINCLDENDLIEKTKKIAEKFDEPSFIIKEVVEEVLNGRDYRFEGTYNLKRVGNQLILDNRNGREVEANREKIKDVISYL